MNDDKKTMYHLLIALVSILISFIVALIIHPTKTKADESQFKHNYNPPIIIKSTPAVITTHYSLNLQFQLSKDIIDINRVDWYDNFQKNDNEDNINNFNEPIKEFQEFLSVTESPKNVSTTINNDHIPTSGVCYYTVYGLSEKWGRGAAYRPICDNQYLVSIDENTYKQILPNGQEVYVHSIASSWGNPTAKYNTLAPGSIIYIPTLDKYFIMMDNSQIKSQPESTWTQVKQTEWAWNHNAQLWIDIFLAPTTGYSEEEPHSYEEIEQKTGIDDGDGYLQYELIRWGK